MAGHEWEDWFEREEFIGQISDMRVQNLQVEREVVQKRTFTRWINLHLEKCDPPIEVHDLFQDIQDGHILMALLEELSGCKLLHGFKKSSHRIFRLNNIAKVLSFLEERNVKLVSIDAADVADGNPSIILGLIWNIILFFQIKELTGNIRCQFPSSSSFSSIPTSSDSDASVSSMPSDEGQLASMAMREQSKAIKKLLQWVQKRTRKFGVAVLDFGKSWTSGLAFLAVIKSIDPSLLDMRKALLRTARENLEEAFRIAHYSLGIPRLLEPEDVIVKAPDEQSIITYVSQFLEHFPGIEEPEEPCLLIERSISLCRLNFRDADSKNMRNGAHRNTVKERSHMFQGDCSQPAPKILISSVSEDRGTMSRPLRPPASRSWSSEDFLADSSFNTEDISNTVVDEPQETETKDLSNSALISPKVSCPQSSTCSSVVGSVNSESVTGDSAINSPDSWEGSDLGVMVETFCESQSDSSICDSGTVCDVYHATPVEISILDEGLILTQEEEVQQTTNVQATTESLLDEVICSQSSSESTQEKFQGHSPNKPAGEMREEEACFDHTQKGASEAIPVSNGAEVTNIDAKRKQKLPLGPFDVEVPSSCEVENVSGTETTTQAQLIDNTELPTADNCGEFIKQSAGKSIDREHESLEKVEGHDSNTLNHEAQSSGQTESQNKSNISEEVEPGITSQKIVPPSEKESVKSSNYTDKEVVQTQVKISEGVLRDSLDLQESFRSVTSDVSANTCPTSPDPSHGRNIPLISISNELEEQDIEETCKTAATLSKESDPGINSSKNFDEVSCDQSNRDAEIPNSDAEIPFCPVTNHDKPTETDINRSSHKNMCQPDTSQNQEISETKQKCESAHTIKSGMNLKIQTSFGDAEVEPMKTEQGTDQQDKMGDSTTIQEEKLNPAYSQHNGKIGTAGKEGSVSTEIEKEFLDFDHNSPMYDLVGDTMEPMDIFYPEKEDPMLSEPLDTEVQSWPLVLSVSALQPAPAKDSLPDGQPLHLLDEDPWSKESSIHNSGEEIAMANQETDEILPSQEQSLPLGEEKGSLLVDVLAGNSDANETEPWRSGSAKKYIEPVRDLKSYCREDESQIPSVLGHKKDLNFSQPMINQTAVTGVAEKDDSNIWMSENSELYLLLLLWILLYCFWLLPQMDVKALPNLLLNL